MLAASARSHQGPETAAREFAVASMLVFRIGAGAGTSAELINSD